MALPSSASSPERRAARSPRRTSAARMALPSSALSPERRASRAAEASNTAIEVARGGGVEHCDRGRARGGGVEHCDRGRVVRGGRAREIEDADGLRHGARRRARPRAIRTVRRRSRRLAAGAAARSRATVSPRGGLPRPLTARPPARRALPLEAASPQASPRAAARHTST